MDYYVIKTDKGIHHMNVGKDGFTFDEPFSHDEALSWIKENSILEYTLINITQDLVEYKIPDNSLKNMLNTEAEYQLSLWFNSYNDSSFNNICNTSRNFSIPFVINANECYFDALSKLFEEYKISINKISTKYEDNFVGDVNNICNGILNAWKESISGNVDVAVDIVRKIVENNIDNPLWVSSLDNSYAFRGVAHFPQLQHSHISYDVMKNEEIIFYRARCEEVHNKTCVLHIPLNQKDKIREQRFSIKETPCLYLGTTSYDCWLECEKPDYNKFYVSSFKFDENGKKLKVLNLAVPQSLIVNLNGSLNKSKENKKLYLSALKLFPLICACSYMVNTPTDGKRYEYVLPQLIMRCLPLLDIDGIAYLSMKGKNEYQYPHGVNLALPIFDKFDGASKYGQICKKMKLTTPFCLGKLDLSIVGGKDKSYINKIYVDKNKYGNDNFSAMVDYNDVTVFYSSLDFSKFDDYLASEEHSYYF